MESQFFLTLLGLYVLYSFSSDNLFVNGRSLIFGRSEEDSEYEKESYFGGSDYSESNSYESESESQSHESQTNVDYEDKTLLSPKKQLPDVFELLLTGLDEDKVYRSNIEVTLMSLDKGSWLLFSHNLVSIIVL